MAKGSRRFRLLRVAAVLLLLAAVYFVWAGAGRGLPPSTPQLFIKYSAEFGANTGSGNILLISPYMLPSDYASRERFQAKIGAYIEEAKRKGWVNSKTIIVLPEYMGTWLVVAGEKRGVYTSATTKDAMGLVVASNLPRFASAYARAEGSDRLRAAVFTMKSDSMARIYNDALSSLSREYGVTIIGGSIVLANPSVKDGRLVSGRGALRNVCPVYGPDGRAKPELVTKVFLTKDEAPFLKPGRVSDLPVFDTPCGKLAVMVCADAWFPESYAEAKRKGAEQVIAVAFGQSDRGWVRTWPGYSGQANPPDVDKADPGKLTEREATLKYAMPGRLTGSGFRNGATVFLNGKLWDLSCGGADVIVIDGKPEPVPASDGASVVSLWMGPRK